MVVGPLLLAVLCNPTSYSEGVRTSPQATEQVLAHRAPNIDSDIEKRTVSLVEPTMVDRTLVQSLALVGASTVAVGAAGVFFASQGFRSPSGLFFFGPLALSTLALVPLGVLGVDLLLISGWDLMRFGLVAAITVAGALVGAILGGALVGPLLKPTFCSNTDCTDGGFSQVFGAGIGAGLAGGVAGAIGSAMVPSE